jgi:flagellar biosynthetic protein FliO
LAYFQISQTKKILLSVLVWLISGLVLADTNQMAAPTPSKDISTFTNWPIILLVLIGMIAFIFSLAWFVKRFGGMNFTGNREMKVVTSIALGTRERIALIDVKGKQFLIGVTTQQINHLHTFDEAVIPMNEKPANHPQGDFITKFQAILSSGKVNNTQDSTLATASNPSSHKASTEDNNKSQGNNVL